MKIISNNIFIAKELSNQITLGREKNLIINRKERYLHMK